MKRQTLTRSLSSFKELKNILEIKRPIKDEKTDEEVFLEAMADVRERQEFRKIPYSSPAMIKIPSPQSEDAIEVLKEIVHGKKKICLSDTGEYIEWTRPGARKDLAKRLSVQYKVDITRWQRLSGHSP